jgi:hypothetical protein
MSAASEKNTEVKVSTVVTRTDQGLVGDIDDAHVCLQSRKRKQYIRKDSNLDVHRLRTSNLTYMKFKWQNLLPFSIFQTGYPAKVNAGKCNKMLCLNNRKQGFCFSETCISQSYEHNTPREERSENAMHQGNTSTQNKTMANTLALQSLCRAEI